MKKTILYRLFKIGGIPKKIGPVLAAEGIEVSDEGIGGWFVTKNVKGPGKRYINRTEGFSGCLVVTGKRIVCFTYGKRQINISVEDPKMSEVFVNVDIHLSKVTTTCCGTDLPASTVKSPGLESHTTTVIDSFRDTCFKLLGHNRDTCRVFSLWGQHYILWSP